VSDIPTDWRGQLDLRAELARIDRDRAETQKLLAERDKFKRDAWVLAFAALLAAFATIIAGVFARLPEILAAFGLPH
jgi:hypothetical protein